MAVLQNIIKFFFLIIIIAFFFYFKLHSYSHDPILDSQKLFYVKNIFLTKIKFESRFSQNFKS